MLRPEYILNLMWRLQILSSQKIESRVEHLKRRINLTGLANAFNLHQNLQSYHDCKDEAEKSMINNIHSSLIDGKGK